MRLALDVMGGDRGPPPNLAGAARALAAVPDLQLVLVGDRPQIEPLWDAAGGATHLSRVEFCHTPGVVGMTEKPVEAFRRTPDNSIAQSWKQVATKQVDGLVSAGNTGAVVAGGLFTKRFLPGVQRPGIATTMPTAKGRTVILDVGANVFPKPAHLLQYAVMGSVYARLMLTVANPTVGLMNVGEEEGKGHELVARAYQLFRDHLPAGRFVGNVEGRDIHKGACDVIVTDGFVGNVILKQAEGLFEFVVALLGQEVLPALPNDRELAGQALKKLYAKFHHSAAGGAPLLGVDGVCVICHGSSDERSIENALTLAAHNVRAKVNEAIVAELAAVDLGEPGA